MMDRIKFLNNVNKIQYPMMLVNFFDHFIALKRIVEDTGTVEVIDNNENNIVFSIKFSKTECQKLALDAISYSGNSIDIYGRKISIGVEVLSDQEIKIVLQ